MLDISIDLGLQSALVRFKRGEYGRTIDLDESTMLDLAIDGTVLGVEFLYFGELKFTRESLAALKGVEDSAVIEAILEAQELLITKLSTASL
jgi:uncharacterized protein YuzE